MGVQSKAKRANKIEFLDKHLRFWTAAAVSGERGCGGMNETNPVPTVNPQKGLLRKSRTLFSLSRFKILLGFTLRRIVKRRENEWRFVKRAVCLSRFSRFGGPGGRSREPDSNQGVRDRQVPLGSRHLLACPQTVPYISDPGAAIAAIARLKIGRAHV